MDSARKQCPGLPQALYIYAAGAFGDNALALRRTAAEAFGLSPDVIWVESDLTGAARALLGPATGVACILGTGSNSCLWDGSRIVSNMRPMGYILGDEGSGAAIGAAMLRTAMRGRLSPQLQSLWDAAYPSLTYASVVEEVYRRHAGSGFTASFAPFVREHIAYPEMEALAAGEIMRFMTELKASYPQLDSNSVSASFTGGIAAAFEPQLRRCAEACGISVGTVCPEPLSLLVSRALEGEF